MHTPHHPPSALILQHAPKLFIGPTLNNCAALLSTCMYMTPTCSLKAERKYLSYPSPATPPLVCTLVAPPGWASCQRYGCRSESRPLNPEEEGGRKASGIYSREEKAASVI